MEFFQDEHQDKTSRFYPEFARKGYKFYSNTPNIVANLQKYQQTAKQLGIKIEFAAPAYDSSDRPYEGSCAILIKSSYEGLMEARLALSNHPCATGADRF